MNRNDFSRASIKDLYEELEVIKYYAKQSLVGLYPDEKKLIQELVKWGDLRPNGNVLVVGSGAGRESLDLCELGLCVTGIDISQNMVSWAKGRDTHRKIKWICQDFLSFDTSQKFDLIYLSLGFTGHFKGQGLRVKLLKKTSGLLSPKGRIAFLPDIYRMPEGSKYHKNSMILKQKDLDWEEGDTLRDEFCERHKLSSQKIFYYFYPSSAEVKTEIKKADLNVVNVKNQMWVLSYES